MTWTPGKVEALAKELPEIDACSAFCEGRCKRCPNDAFKDAASALTWALQAYKIEMAARRGFEAALQRSMAERDAANARAESARDAALADGVKWIRGQMNDDDSDEYSAGYNDGLKAAAMLLSSAPLREELGRALKESGK